MSNDVNIKADIKDITSIRNKLINNWSDIENNVISKVDEVWNDKGKESFVLSIIDVKNGLSLTF